MGLDTVELVMAIEHRFDIRVPDEVWARTRSVGDLAAVVLSHKSEVVPVCPTAQSFFALRRTLVRAAQLERRQLRPSTPLEVAVSRENRRCVWALLEQLHWGTPGLMTSPASDIYLRALASLLFAAWISSVVAHSSVSIEGGIAFGFVLATALFALWLLASFRLRVEIPPGLTNLGDLARKIAPPPLPKEALEFEQVVLNEVRRLTAEQAGVQLADVRLETRIVDDLGMD